MIRELAMEWRSAGLERGDSVLIHSSLKRTCKRTNLTPEQVLDSFLEAVGPSGTLLLPLFNFSFTKGVPFDIRSTTSEMGKLTEAARSRSGAVRSGHPIYSFAVVGFHARQFAVDNFSGYGLDSPFGILTRLDGKIAVLDLDDQNSMTYYHHVEECVGAPYRHHKTFTAPYTDAKGVTTERTYGLFVRNDGVKTAVNPMGELLWELGHWKGFRHGEGCGLRVIRALDCYRESASVIRSGKADGLLFSTSQPTQVLQNIPSVQVASALAAPQ